MLLIAPSTLNDLDVHLMAQKRLQEGDKLYSVLPDVREDHLFEDCIYDDLRVYFETKLPGLEVCLVGLVNEFALSSAPGAFPGVHVDLGADGGTLFALYQIVKLRQAGKLPSDLFVGVTVNRPGKIGGTSKYWQCHPLLRRRLALDALMLADEVFVTSKEACGVLFDSYPRLERDISGLPSADEQPEEPEGVLSSIQDGSHGKDGN